MDGRSAMRPLAGAAAGLFPPRGSDCVRFEPGGGVRHYHTAYFRLGRGGKRAWPCGYVAQQLHAGEGTPRKKAQRIGGGRCVPIDTAAVVRSDLCRTRLLITGREQTERNLPSRAGMCLGHGQGKSDFQSSASQTRPWMMRALRARMHFSLSEQRGTNRDAFCAASLSHFALVGHALFPRKPSSTQYGSARKGTVQADTLRKRAGRKPHPGRLLSSET